MTQTKEKQLTYHIIVNSLRVKGIEDERIKIVKSVLDRAGKKYAFYFTDHAGHAGEIAAMLTADRTKIRLVAMGGDGTLHEVLNGVADPALVKLGVIPVGSGNDFAAAAGIPEDDVKFAAQLLAFRSPAYIDYIQLEPGPRSLNVAGCGMDVEVLKHASGRKGKSKYIGGFFKSVFKYEPMVFDAEVDGGVRKTYTALLACIGNGRQIGAGIKVLPEANIDDGLLNLLIVDYKSRPRGFWAFAKIFFGKLNSVGERTQAVCRTATIYPRSQNFTIQAEGELYNFENCQKITASIVSGKLRFYMPHAD